MTLSAPIYVLKQRARKLARENKWPLHRALDQTASSEGFSTWSLMVRKAQEQPTARALLERLTGGGLLLIGARPRQGKTRLALEVLGEARARSARTYFFSLDFSETEARRYLADRGLPDTVLDCSDDIDAERIQRVMADAPAGSAAVVDYLQVLDQKRSKAPVAEQVRALQAFARSRGLVLVFVSQVSRRFDQAEREVPGLEDVHLPNALDLGLFDQTCFMHDGRVASGVAG